MQYHTLERRHSGAGNRPPLAYLESEGFNPRQRCLNYPSYWVEFGGAVPPSTDRNMYAMLSRYRSSV